MGLVAYKNPLINKKQKMNYVSQSATSTALIGAVNSDVLTQVLYSVGSVLAIAVLLLGIGFAWKKLQQRAVGRTKF